MLVFAMSCLRCDPNTEPVKLIMAGRWQDAVQLAMPRLERKPLANQVQGQAALGQVIGRALIRLGRAEEAEELFRRQRRTYELVSRPYVRWMTSLDHGEIQLVMNRPSRAAQSFGSVADDLVAPPALRIEALAGLAGSLQALGEYRRAHHALQLARALALQEPSQMLQRLIDGLLLEGQVKQQLCAFDEGSAPAAQVDSSASDPPLQAQLQRCCHALEELPVAAERLTFLEALADRQPGSLSRLHDTIRRLHVAKLVEQEHESRVEAALARVAAGDGAGAQDLLGRLAHDEDTLRRQRQSLELRYCLSRIYALQGRHVDALRLYKDHVAQILSRLHAELAHLPYLRCLERQEMMDQSDSAKLMLPLRYRRAYQYILDHLNDRDLSVREVALHVGVTERSLQMAFRTHLGISPAELIRRRRVEHIRKDLQQSSNRRTVADVAQDWGVSNRSTMNMAFRKIFLESPSSSLNGGAWRSSAACIDEVG